MDRSMTGRGAEAIPNLSVARVVVASLAVIPSPEPATVLCRGLAVLLLGAVMAPSPQG